MGLHLESSELEVRGVPSSWKKEGHYNPHEVDCLIAQEHRFDVSMMPRSYITMFHHNILQVISPNMLA